MSRDRADQPLVAPIPIVILAAGESRRLGSAKQLVQFRGRTLLAHAVATAQAAAAGPVLVVLGARIDIVRAEITDPTVRVVANPAWAEGMGSSVRVAVAAVLADLPEARAILFLVADQPLVTSDLINELITAYDVGYPLVASCYDETLGVPVLFDRRYFAELSVLPGDAGARRVLARHSAAVHAIPFAGGVVDVDTPADAAHLAELAAAEPITR